MTSTEGELCNYTSQNDNFYRTQKNPSNSQTFSMENDKFFVWNLEAKFAVHENFGKLFFSDLVKLL